MNVLVTLIALAVVGVWWFAVYNRLLRLREGVKDAWKALEPDQEDVNRRDTYNARVKIYNEALATFPANVVAWVSGFTPARVFQ